MLTAILFIAVCCVAFTNGANANFKGVASLYGSGTASLRVALWWGTATTFAGSIAAAFLADYLLKAFSGKGIVPDALVASPAFLSAVAIGAALTSFFATRLGFPVSTTHALLGALVGAGLAGSGAEVKFDALLMSFVLPLALSPVVAAILGPLVYGILRLFRLAPEERTPTLDFFHYLSTGAASFARGLNDTPKIVALLLIVLRSKEPDGIDLLWGFAAVALAIACGGILDADRVAETLGKKVTDMDPGQGFSASLVTAGLVISASIFGLPLSTTHVSVGSLLGIGAVTRQAKWLMAGEILLAWICTVPCGALLAAAAYGVIGMF